VAVFRTACLAGLWALCAACAGVPQKPGRPAWAVARAHPDFPAAQWLIGTGEGIAPAEAADRAYSDLMEAVRVAARRELSEADVQALGRLSRIEARWQSRDGRRHAALAALAREDLDRYLADSLRAQREAIAAAELEAAGEMEKSRQVYPALQRALRAVAAGGGGEPGRYLDRLLQAIQMRLRDGERRVLPPGTREVSVSGAVELVFPERFVPVAGAPVRISLAGADGPAAQARTDAEGNVQASLALPARFERGEVVLSLDAGTVLAEAGTEAQAGSAELAPRLLARSARQWLEIAAESGARLRLAVVETRSGRAVESAVAGARLAEELRRAGLRVTTDGPALDPDVQPSQASRLLSGSAELLLVGRIDAGVVQVVSDSFLFAEAAGVLRLLRVSDGQMLQRVELSTRAAGSDEWNAADRALSQFARKALPRLLDALAKAASAR